MARLVLFCCLVAGLWASVRGVALPLEVDLAAAPAIQRRGRADEVNDCKALLVFLAASQFCSSFAHITDTTTTVTQTRPPVLRGTTITAHCTSTVPGQTVTNVVTQTLAAPVATQTLTAPATTETDTVTVGGPTTETTLVLTGISVDETITLPAPTTEVTVTDTTAITTITTGVLTYVTTVDQAFTTVTIPFPFRRRQAISDTLRPIIYFAVVIHY